MEFIQQLTPLNIPKLNNLRRMKEIVLTPIASNWWTDFSTLKDFPGILRSGSKLTMHYIVTKINSQLELLENNMSYVDVIDDNGNMIIQHDETFPTLAQELIVKAKKTENIESYSSLQCGKEHN